MLPRFLLTALFPTAARLATTILFTFAFFTTGVFGRSRSFFVELPAERTFFEKAWIGAQEFGFGGCFPHLQTFSSCCSTKLLLAQHSLQRLAFEIALKRDALALFNLFHRALLTGQRHALTAMSTGKRFLFQAVPITRIKPDLLGDVTKHRTHRRAAVDHLGDIRPYAEEETAALGFLCSIQGKFFVLMTGQQFLLGLHKGKPTIPLHPLHGCTFLINAATMTIMIMLIIILIIAPIVPMVIIAIMLHILLFTQTFLLCSKTSRRLLFGLINRRQAVSIKR